jgi:hypothetical protein
MIPVCWYEGIFGLYAHEGVHGRSRYACCGLLNDMFDSYQCEHYSGFSALPVGTKGAVLIIHGGHLRHDVDKINQDAAKLDWVIFIGIGDEESDFPYHLLWHRNMKLWIQTPIPSRHRFANHYILEGYPCDMHDYICNVPNASRSLDWFFVGQTNHTCRIQMAEQLRQMPNGKLVETTSFYANTVNHEEYFRTMGQAKVVLCPTGPATPDSFRFAEALEAGCVPIVDTRPSWKPEYPSGFWEMMFPQGMPFPIIYDWKTLPRIMETVLGDYETIQRNCAVWWAEYKRNYFLWLGQDLKALGVSL